MITKDEFEKAVEVCTNTDKTCAQCPLSKKFFTCGGYLARYIRYIKENEPAPAATDTSSEVSSSDTKKILAHLDDSTKEQICQAYDTADEVCTDILTIYEGMSPQEQRAFDIGEAYGKIFSTRNKLKELKGADSK